MSDVEPPRRNRARLQEYYGSAKADGSSPDSSARPSASPEVSPGGAGVPTQHKVNDNPLDINGHAFNAEVYTQKLIKEASLSQLMAQETEIVRQIQSLDSDMQTLVYENYNKFISATDTIKKMRMDFRGMEDEMDQLATKMQNITVFSGEVSETLKERRQQISKLSGTHALLKKLQFLFELPTKLNECITDENYTQGVTYYARAQRVLEQYQHLQSFHGIKEDCDKIILELKKKLQIKLKNPETPAGDLSTCVDLLLQLNEPAEEVCDVYLATAQVKLDESLNGLERQVKLASGEEKKEVERPKDAFEKSTMDVLEFIDHGCNTFLSDICLVIAAYNETFVQRNEIPGTGVAIDDKMAQQKLNVYVTALMNRFFETVESRVRLERNLNETAILVRSLDRFHRRLQAMTRLMPGIDFSRFGLDLVLRASEAHCQVTLEHLQMKLQDSLIEIRQRMAAPKPRLAADAGDGEVNLLELNNELLAVIADKIRSQLTNLQLFIDPEITFAVKTYYRAKFCRYFVREGVLVAYLNHIVQVCKDFCGDGHTEKTVPPVLLLLLSRTCLDLQTSTTQYLMSMLDEQFFIDDCSSGLTSVAKINASFRDVAQKLLNQYVRLEGQVLSQMLRKSVETRDWLNTVEPRTVRAVMKRVVEEVTAIDRQVSGIYEEGHRKSRSSDSSRRTRMSQAHSRARTNWSVTPSTMDSSLASNIQKMFLEKIEIFSSAEFSRISILTGIIKIALKTLLECVRLRTFSRYGFQQIQVDAHYLQLYLWRFVSDENLVTFLLDEVMTSVVHRCLEPVPMEPSVVEVICDRG